MDTMSSIGSVVLDAEQDALWMKKEQFVEAYGKAAQSIWEIQNGEMEHPQFEQWKEERAGFHE
jgi:hypothetical protein